MLKLLKLLKYEGRYYARILPLMYGVLILAALALGIKERVKPSTFFSSNPPEFFWFLLILVGGIACVITLVFIVHRFIDNLLKAPGYLSLTLPVTVWHILAAKTIAAVCAALATVGICLASGVILFELALRIDAVFWTSLGGFMPSAGALPWVKNALFVIVTAFRQAALIYALITVSRLLPKFRNFCAVAGWFLAGAIEHIIESRISIAFGSVPSLSLSHLSFVSIAAQAVFACLYFLAAGFLLKKTFNAE
jgi:hypothetical protein